MSSILGEVCQYCQEIKLLSMSAVISSIGILAYLISKYYHWNKVAFESGGKRPPNPPCIGSMPLLGSIPFLPLNVEALHPFLLEKTKLLGGVFTIKLGSTNCIALTTYESIQDAFIKHAADYAGRHNPSQNDVVNPQGKGFICATYTPTFRKCRRLSVTILKEFGLGGNVMETRIMEEVQTLLVRIKNCNGKPFYPKEFITTTVHNVLLKIMFGEHSDGLSLRIQKLDVDHLAFIENALAYDFLFPLRLLPRYRKNASNFNISIPQLFAIFDEEIDRILSTNATDNFVSSYVQREGKEFDIVELQTVIMELVNGATDTTRTTLLWFVVLLANYPDVQKRLQEEIDSVFLPKGRLPSLADKNKVVYLEAVTLEMMRYRTVAPMIVPHVTMCDTEAGGFFVPKDTVVWGCLYSAHMNVNDWKDPDVFRPDRFLDSAGNIINKERAISFSLGTRGCVGEHMARQELFLVLTSLLQKFDILPPEGGTHISEKAILHGVSEPTPFTVRFISRDP